MRYLACRKIRSTKFRTRLPIAKPRASSGIIDTYFRILEILSGRFTAGEVFAILEAPAVQRCFQIAAAEMETIRRWVNDCAIRWGIDAQHRGPTWLALIRRKTAGGKGSTGCC